MTEASGSLIKVAAISHPHGVRGQVKVVSFTEDFEALASRLTYLDDSGLTQPIALKIVGNTKDYLIGSLAGVTTRNQAEAWKGKALFVSRTSLPKTAANQYYYEDLIGLNVVLTNGAAYGKVKAIHNYGAGDILEITLANGLGNEMLPFTQSFFPEIDISASRITIVPAEYLTS